MATLPRSTGMVAPGFGTPGDEPTFERDGAPPIAPVRSSLGIVSVVFALCLCVTLLIAAVPSFRFAVHLPKARAPIETLGVVVAVLAAVLASFRYSLTGARTFLFVALAFAVLGLNRLVFGFLSGDSGSVDLDVYLWTVGRLVTAGLLLLGALPSGRAWRTNAQPMRELLVGLAVVVWAVSLSELFLLLNVERLPPLASVNPIEPAAITGWAPGLSVAGLGLGFTGAAVFLAAAVLYARPSSGPGTPLLAPALVLAAFSHLHYMLTPTLYSEWISTGDLLRLGFSVAVMTGLLVEVRRAYRAERDRMRELAVAYAAERTRAEELEALDRTRAELLRLATHELMHPVSAIRTWVVTLRRRWGELDDEQKAEILGKLDAETQRLRDLAERTPEVTGARALVFPIVPRSESVIELVNEVTTSVALDGRLTVDVRPDAGRAFVRADATRVLQVLWNLLSNATKYSGPDAPVELSVRRSGSEVSFTVADRGWGIPPEDLDRVFDLAYRGGAPSAGATRGSGLGLYICRRIVEAHGGRIRAELRHAGGTAVGFTLPLVDGEQ